MDTKFKALIALLATVLMWSVSAIIARTLVQEISPMVLSLLRMGTATLLFLPFVIKYRPWNEPQFKNLLAISLLSSINTLSFIWGIQYTSASASQLIYAAIPIFIVLINIVILREKVSLGKILGVVLGFLGLLYIVYLSVIEKGSTISGHFIGNFAIFVAATGWLFYILLSKRMSKHFNPAEIGGVSIFVTLFVNILLVIIEQVTVHPTNIWNLNALLGGLYMGVFGTFLTYILFQYGLKYLSPLTTSLANYIQPITTAILAGIFLNEKLTANFTLGSAFVFAGIFLTTTLEVYKRSK